MTKARAMRELLARKELVVSPNVYDGYSAMLVAKMGFKAAATTGAGLSNARLGLPDIGLLSMKENVEARNPGENSSVTAAPPICVRLFTVSPVPSATPFITDLPIEPATVKSAAVVFRQTDIEVPEAWSQVACDVLAQKYFRRAGLPTRLKAVEENDVPSFLWRKVPDAEALAALPENERKTGEISAKQVFHRLAGTWAYWGWKGGYFDTEDDAHAFYDEMCHMLAAQKAAPNSLACGMLKVSMSAGSLLCHLRAVSSSRRKMRSIQRPCAAVAEPFCQRTPNRVVAGSTDSISLPR